jgi:type II secretory pathway pseudopilin PulG
MRRQNRIDRNRISEHGFSLVELAMVIIIGGLLIGTMSSMLLVYMRNTQIKTTQQRIDEVDNAIQEYLNLNGNLPCAAPRNAAVDTPEFGAQLTPVDCALGGDGVATAGAGASEVLVGAVPVRSINLPDDYAFDAWGNRLTYAVTADLATPGKYDRDKGAISIIDSAGNSIVTPDGSAHYVVLSHGPDGVGATTFAGVPNGSACPDDATLDGENCNDDATFRRTMLTASAPGAAHFDDLLKYRATSAFGNDIPAGSVMAFDLAACPPGWTQLADSGGRFIMGAGTFPAQTFSAPGHSSWSEPETSYLPGSTGGYPTWTNNLNDLGLGTIPEGTIPAPDPTNGLKFTYAPSSIVPLAESNLPPYIALILCKK